MIMRNKNPLRRGGRETEVEQVRGSTTGRLTKRWESSYLVGAGTRQAYGIEGCHILSSTFRAISLSCSCRSFRAVGESCVINLIPDPKPDRTRRPSVKLVTPLEPVKVPSSGKGTQVHCLPSSGKGGSYDRRKLIMTTETTNLKCKKCGEECIKITGKGFWIIRPRRWSFCKGYVPPGKGTAVTCRYFKVTDASLGPVGKFKQDYTGLVFPSK